MEAEDEFGGDDVADSALDMLGEAEAGNADDIEAKMELE